MLNSRIVPFLVREKFSLRSHVSMIHQNCEMFTYREAIEKLNLLQSNAASLRSKPKGRASIIETINFLKECNIEIHSLDKLNMIHVTGTKGKGSTCAYVESIFRTLGFKTGFYSSPHLINARERIRINGSAISEAQFAKYFHQIYKTLLLKKEDHMPTFFQFLTVMAFHVFLEENIDVAIVEVGIGGEYDCTNVIKNPIVCGITALDLDHTKLLGKTIESIAWQKSGIFKKGSVGIVADYEPATLNVMMKRAVEKECSIYLAPSYDQYVLSPNSPQSETLQHCQLSNISLAMQIVKMWLQRTGNNLLHDKMFCEDNRSVPQKTAMLPGFKVPSIFVKGLRVCKWPGRFQILPERSSIYYLDGAHTPKSIEFCASWYLNARKNEKNGGIFRILLFHCTGDRSPEPLLLPLLKCGFELAIFCLPQPERVLDSSSDQINLLLSADQLIQNVSRNKQAWISINKNEEKVKQFTCTRDAITMINSVSAEKGSVEILVTGSLHLIGGVLSVLNYKI